MQTLRSVLDDPRLDDLPPHLTLVPPVNVSAVAFDDGLTLLRSVAASTTPFALDVGPAGTFAPATPTLHLELGGELEPLFELRRRLRTGPFGRPDEWPFHPHITLREELQDPARSGTVEAMAGGLGSWSVDRVHLLEQQRDDEGRRRWVPVVEEPFGPAVVVGRGGIELELRATRIVPCGLEEWCAEVSLGDTSAVDGRDALVVSASSRGGTAAAPPLGVAGGELLRSSDGGVAVLHSVAVDASSRRLGIGRQLLRQWCHLAEVGGAAVAVHDRRAATPDDDGSLAALLGSEGFVQVGTAHVRQLRTG